MSKLKNKGIVLEEVVVPTEEVVVSTKKVEEIKFPEVSRTGRFQSVAFGTGFVVYNPDACRVSGILTATQANDIVRRQNFAAQIKG
jgi:hypothetical protein